MKPAPFEYVRPASLDEALLELERGGEGGRALAGGQSLIPLLNMRLATPQLLVDISRLPELRGVEVGPSVIRVGAACPMAVLERHPGLAQANPLLAATLPHIGHFQIRNRGTIGGSIAHLDPAAELPAVALLLGARLQLQRRGASRSVGMSDFILGSMESVLGPGEIVTQIEFRWPPGSHWGFAEIARRSGDFALVGAAAFAPPGGEPQVVVFGAGPRAQMLPLSASAAASSDLGAVAGAAQAEIEAWDDIHAGAAYRRAVGARIVRRVMAEALGGSGDMARDRPSA